MSTLKIFIRRIRKETQALDKIKMRSHLNADALFALIREDLQNAPDHRAVNASIPLVDAIKSGLATLWSPYKLEGQHFSNKSKPEFDHSFVV